MRKLTEFVIKLANSEKYLCPKFEEGLSLEIREKMSVFGSQSYKKVMQLALRMKKLTDERMSRGSFQKRKGLVSCLDSNRRRVKVLILLEIPLNLKLILLVLRSLFDHHNRPSWVRHH